eukprot:scaffold11007_cov65-Phaeocystis_antarctica.AAC.1
MLERAASEVTHFPAFDHAGAAASRPDRARRGRRRLYVGRQVLVVCSERTLVAPSARRQNRACVFLWVDNAGPPRRNLRLDRKEPVCLPWGDNVPPNA